MSISDVDGCDQCLGHLCKDVEILYEVLSLRSLCCLFGLSMSCLSCSSVRGHWVLLSV